MIVALVTALAGVAGIVVVDRHDAHELVVAALALAFGFLGLFLLQPPFLAELLEFCTAPRGDQSVTFRGADWRERGKGMKKNERTHR